MARPRVRRLGPQLIGAEVWRAAGEPVGDARDHHARIHRRRARPQTQVQRRGIVEASGVRRVGGEGLAEHRQADDSAVAVLAGRRISQGQEAPGDGFYIPGLADIGGFISTAFGGSEGVNATKYMSQAGYTVLYEFERGPNGRAALVPYVDDVGVSTIGWGHAIKAGESFTRITEQQAQELLVKDVAIFERAVRAYVKVPLKQCQFDALVCWTFNFGETRLRKSTLLQKINAGDFKGAHAEFAKWNKGTVNGQSVVLNGLVRRRAMEAALFARDGL